MPPLEGLALEGLAFEGLAPVDGWVVAAILAKAVGYAAALLAMGGALFLAVFARDAAMFGREAAGASGPGTLVRRVTIAAALVLVAVLALRFGIRSARISGMGLEGMTDATMLGFVWSSPLGSAAIWRGAGAALVLFVVLRNAAGMLLGVAGAVLIAASYAQVGHSLGEPRWLLGSLLVAHLLAVAYWVGALVPLRRAARSPDGAALLHRFGTIATGVVGLLVMVGASFAWFVSGSATALLGTAYGWTLLAKVALVAALLGLAALNKLRLVPALASGDPMAAPALRRSIAWEGAAVALILVATAALTTITTPPANL